MFNKLKPCPFCGNEARLVTYTTNGCPNRPGAYVQCDVCESSTRSIVDVSWNGENISKVIEAWNKRVFEEVEDA